MCVNATSYQAVQLRDGALRSWLANVPHLDAALTSRVDVLGGVRDGDCANDLSVT